MRRMENRRTPAAVQTTSGRLSTGARGIERNQE